MKDYSTLSDTALHKLCSGGNADAENELAARYSRVVRACARPFFLAGGDSEDLMQEGMLGLLSAIREYKPESDASFKTYAELCIRRRLISAVRSASRMKHAPLNEGVSLDEILSKEAQPGSAFCGESFRRVPEEQVLARESKNDFILSVSRYLSDFEVTILTHYLDGLSYNEIASMTGRSLKSVDNAVQRIRHKLARHLNLGDYS